MMDGPLILIRAILVPAEAIESAQTIVDFYFGISISVERRRHCAWLFLPRASRVRILKDEDRKTLYVEDPEHLSGPTFLGLPVAWSAFLPGRLLPRPESYDDSECYVGLLFIE